MAMPFPDLSRVFVSISDVPCINATLLSERPFDRVIAMLKPPADVPSIEMRTSIRAQTLRAWDAEEEKVFCKDEKKAKDGPKSKPIPGRKKPPPQQPPLRF